MTRGYRNVSNKKYKYNIYKNKNNISADYVQMSEQVFKNSSWKNEKIVKIVLNNVR